jgi:hypothetical protein
MIGKESLGKKKVMWGLVGRKSMEMLEKRIR